ncbi:hypothetical protein RFI_33249, partial [Reticulomyxa filosa]
AFDNEIRTRNKTETQPRKQTNEIPTAPQYLDAPVLELPKTEHKTLTNQILSNVSKGIVEIGNMNRKAFGLVFSTVDTVQGGIKELNNAIKDVSTRTISMFSKSVDPPEDD